MLLCNLQLVDKKAVINIVIKDGLITATGDVTGNSADKIIFDNAIVFPGLINAHDHLDFNLFPQLGNKVYDNYVDWGLDINIRNRHIIEEVLKVPKALRAKWGIYKNLLNGITTVVDHGDKIVVTNELITVYQECHSLHSVRLEKLWKWRLNTPFATHKPFVMHIGEGTDEASRNEVDTLIRWNLFRRNIIGVHGISMNEQQAGSFKAVVWCPFSNFFLIGNTAQIDLLKKNTAIVFGTDSTVSASWNIWEHLRLAQTTKLVSDEELYTMLNTQQASVWGMEQSGQIKEGYDADLVIAKQKDGLEGYPAFYKLNPEDILLVMHKGDIKLFDASILKQINTHIVLDNFSKVLVGGAVKYICGNLPQLMTDIKSYYPGATFPVEICS